MNKRVNQEAINILKKLEGFSSVAYKDIGGLLTIGYGTTWDVKDGDTITKENAEKRLKLDLMKVEKCANENVFRDLTDNQFSAICLFIYNIGCSAFIGSTLCRLLNQHKPIEECSQWFTPWNKITINGEKVFSQGLANRREAERKLFLN